MNNHNLSYCILGVVFVAFLLINFQMPFISDDYWYGQVWDKTRHLEEISDIINFQINHYIQWGGRSVAHTIAQITIFFGKPLFNILNSIVFILLIIGMYYHIKGQITKQFEPMLLMTIIFLAFFCLPRLGETTIWLVGSCNYLWMTSLILWFLLPYRLASIWTFKKLTCKYPQYFNPLMFLSGIIAGWTNENTGIAMLLGIFIVNFYCWKKNNLYSWMIWGMMGAIIGYCLLIFAPGNYARLASAQTENYSFLKNHVIDSLKTMSTLFFHQLPIYFIAIALIRKIYQYKKSISFKDWEKWYAQNKVVLFSSLVYILLSYIAQFAMFGSPTFPQRAGMGAAVLMIIGALQLLRIDICNDFILYKKKVLISVIMIGLWSVNVIWAFNCYHTLQMEHQVRMQFIAEEKEKGVKDIRFPRFSVKDRSALGLVTVDDISTNPNQGRNLYYARYFGVDTMACTK